jgi:Ca-activated chloride channel family protein
MNFEHLDYLPWVVLAALLLVVSTLWLERKFFNMVKMYWFYRRSFFSFLSTFIFFLGMTGLLFSLLDLRGAEEKIKAGVPTERTIILIDTSASMLAEDVRPSRLEKSVLIAKHFARKAVGQQLAIVAFAEIQKKIVPFTNDLDLIDARLESIKNLRNQNGSSALSGAIQESIQYFKETGEARGNILVITDGEETAEGINLNIPKEIYVAFVGVGTNQGGRIPLDDGQGFRFGYKKTRGQDVITRLNEDFFKKTVSDLPTSEYWLANTYNFPTDEILDFFKAQKGKGDKEQDMMIKPVLMEWIVVPSIILLIMSYFFKAIRVFTLSIFLVILPIKAEEAIEMTPELKKKMEMLQNGDLNRLEKIKLADDLQKAGAKEEAIALYQENLPQNPQNGEIPPQAYLNYGTGLLEKGEEQGGLEVYDSLVKSLPKDDEQTNKIKDMIQKNITNYFKVQEQKKEQQKKEQDKKDEQEKNSSEKNGEGSGTSGDKESSTQNNKQGQNSNEKDQKQDKGDDQQDKNKQDEKENEQDKNQPTDKDSKDKEGDQKKLPPQKVPPKLKQLMSDDRQLQLKIIEQGTRDMNKRKNRENKDW